MPTVTLKPAKAPKATKPKPMHLTGLRHVKMLKAKPKLHKTPNTKQAAAKKTKSVAWTHNLGLLPGFGSYSFETPVKGCEGKHWIELT